MGDYSHVEVRFAESDFEPEEREFMARLWARYFEPAQSLWGRPDSYQEKEALRKQVHADLRLPGSDGDWRFLLPEEIDGRRYYLAIDSLPAAIIPPFPRKLASVYRLREKYGIRPIWYAMFAPTDYQDDRLRFLTTVGQARRRFAENLDGIWELLFAEEEEREALMVAAPEGSDTRKCLDRIFDRLPFSDYLAVLKFLAGDWGGDALIELNYYEVAYCFSPPDEYKAAVQAEFESTLRVFEPLRRLDIAAFPGEVFFESSRSYPGSGIAPWLAPYQHREAVRLFQRWFIPDF